MPNYNKREIEDDLEIAARVMRAVERQIEAHRLALQRIRLLRREFAVDAEMRKKVMSTPESMAALLLDRGIPENLAYPMAAEDFQSPAILDQFVGGRLGFWTYSCCCTSCCLTSCDCTVVTVHAGQGAASQGGTGATAIADRDVS
jgi:hypothetical protein